MRIGIDVGHSAVKVWGAQERHFQFPARVLEAPVTMDLGQLGGHADAVTVREGHGAPVTYWVGERAVALAPPLWSRDKAADPLTRVLVYAAMSQAGIPDGPVGVGIGLPLAWFAKGQGPLRAALLGQRVELTRNGRTHHWTLAAVRVLPQGAIAAVSLHARGRMQTPGLYVVVDIGYRTTEYVVVDIRDGRVAGRPEWSGMLDVGWSAVDEDAARRVSDDHHATVPASMLTGDSIVVQGQTVDLGPYRTAGVTLLASRITQGVQATLGNAWTTLRGAVVIGGAASVVAPRLGWAPLPIEVPSAPAFANAQGYWDAVAAMPVPLDPPASSA
jgi:hypothetical protein